MTGFVNFTSPSGGAFALPVAGVWFNGFAGHAQPLTRASTQRGFTYCSRTVAGAYVMERVAVPEAFDTFGKKPDREIKAPSRRRYTWHLLC